MIIAKDVEIVERLNMRLLVWLQAHDQAVTTGNKAHADSCWDNVESVTAELVFMGVEVDIRLRQRL